MIAPARQAAYELLCRIELRQAHSDDVLHSEIVSSLELRDRNLVTEITYGTLRWQAWLDYILDGAISRSPDSVDRRARILLRLSLYQMARMDRMPAHAVINDAVELAKHNLRPGTAGFINGVLRTLGRQRPWVTPDFHRDCPIWVRVSLPRWLWIRWEARFGIDHACEYALSLTQPPQTAFRGKVGKTASSPSGISDGMDERGHSRLPPSTADVRPSDVVSGAYVVKEGKQFCPDDDQYIQDEASQLIPHLFGPIEGARVWDACAAPGGKSAILIEKCGSSGWVISSDLELARARRMLEMLGRRGRGHSHIVVADAQRPPPFLIRFDAVLADVPCSGLGTLRRNPEIKWRLQPDWLPEFSRKQSRLLDSMAGAVLAGGLLIYSTCSTEPEENEQVIEDFLHVHPEFRILKPVLPPGIETWLDSRGLFRSYPDPRGWDGFFAALMVRAS